MFRKSLIVAAAATFPAVAQAENCTAAAEFQLGPDATRGKCVAVRAYFGRDAFAFHPSSVMALQAWGKPQSLERRGRRDLP